MRIRIFLVLLLFANAVALASEKMECRSLPMRLDAALSAQIDPIVDSALTQGFAGGVAVSRDGAFIYHRVAGTADLEGTIPVTEATLFHVASIAKYFTAVLVLKAAEHRDLRLDDLIAPFVEGTELAARGVTFRDLLTHRSGLGSSYAAETTGDAQQALEAIDAAGIDESRAGSFRYSNDGYDVLGIILERVYDQTYEDLIREKLLKPACLSHVGFWGESDMTDPKMVSQPLLQVSESLLHRNYGLLGSGGLLITAADLVAWQHALRTYKVIYDSTLEQLFVPRGEVSIGQATLGAFLIEVPGLGNAIRVGGYEDWGDNAFLKDYFDCGVTVAIVTSRGPAESSGEPPYRVSISNAIEEILANHCAAGENRG